MTDLIEATEELLTDSEGNTSDYEDERSENESDCEFPSDFTVRTLDKKETYEYQDSTIFGTDLAAVLKHYREIVDPYGPLTDEEETGLLEACAEAKLVNGTICASFKTSKKCKLLKYWTDTCLTHDPQEGIIANFHRYPIMDPEGDVVEYVWVVSSNMRKKLPSAFCTYMKNFLDDQVMSETTSKVIRSSNYNSGGYFEFDPRSPEHFVMNSLCFNDMEEDMMQLIEETKQNYVSAGIDEEVVKNVSIKDTGSCYMKPYRDIRHVLVWDIEAYCTPTKPFLTPYAVSACVFEVDDLSQLIKDYYVGIKKGNEDKFIDNDTLMTRLRNGTLEKRGAVLFEGVSCMDEFLEFAFDAAVKSHRKYPPPDNATEKEWGLLCYAFNGAKFDTKILLQLMDRETVQVAEDGIGLKNVVLYNSETKLKPGDRQRIETMLKFRDILHNIPPESLKSICENYNVPEILKKGEFNFFKVTSFKTANKFKHEWKPYVHNDVYSAAWVLQLINDAKKETLSRLLGEGRQDSEIVFNVYNYLTLPQVSEAFIYGDSKSLCLCYKDCPTKTANKMVYYGGKTDVMENKMGLRWNPPSGYVEPAWVKRLFFYQDVLDDVRDPVERRKLQIERAFVLGAFPKEAKVSLLLSLVSEMEEEWLDEYLERYFEKRGEEMSVYWWRNNFSRDTADYTFSIPKLIAWLCKKDDSQIDEMIKERLGMDTRSLQTLEMLNKATTEWMYQLKERYGNGKMWSLESATDRELDNHLAVQFDENSLYPAANYYAPLPTGRKPCRVTYVEGDARAWLEEGPHPEAPSMPNGDKFPVSHYGIYVVDLEPPTNASELPTLVVNANPMSYDYKKDRIKNKTSKDSVLDWHTAKPYRKRFMNSFDLWCATHLQGWQMSRVYYAVRYECSFEIGRTYHKLYKERLRIKKVDKSGQLALKATMNSGYGRCGMKDTMGDNKVWKDVNWDMYYNIGGSAKVSSSGTCFYKSNIPRLNLQPTQLGSACTAAARTIMFMAQGKDMLSRTRYQQYTSGEGLGIYMDTDSTYMTLPKARKWKERGLLGSELGQLKSDTVESGDGVYVLLYFPCKKVKLAFALDFVGNKDNGWQPMWVSSVTLKGPSKSERPILPLHMLCNYQVTELGGSVTFKKRRNVRDSEIGQLGMRDSTGTCLGGVRLDLCDDSTLKKTATHLCGKQHSKLLY